MGFIEADGARAVRDAARHIAENRQRELSVPLGIMYYAGLAVMAYANRKGNERMLTGYEEKALEKIENTFPQELLLEGHEGYRGDLDKQFKISLSYAELEVIGSSAISVTLYEDNSTLSPTDPIDRIIVEEYKDRFLNAFLVLQEIFVGSGGRRNKIMSKRVKAAIS